MIKLIFLFTGTLSFGLAIAGVFLPVLPTTPFVLLAIYLFSKGHPEKVNEVLNHPSLKPYIKDYLSKDGIPKNAKIRAIIVLWLSILISIIFFIPSILIRLVCLTSATLVTIYIITRKTKK